MRRLPLAIALLASAAVLTACGSASRPGDRIPGTTLTIYSSLPLHGASSIDANLVLRGETTALAQLNGRVGKYRIVLRALDDSTPQQNGWDPGQTTLDARAALADRTAIGYLGEFNSGASAISIPLLNRAGIPQISAASTAVGLTTAGAGSSPGEPEKYYPTGSRTFARVVPNDAVQAGAQVALQKSAGCRHPYVLDDGGVDGQDTADSFAVAAKAAGLQLLALTSFDPRASDYSGLAIGVRQSGADCVLLSATSEASAALLSKQIAAASPSVRLFAAAGVADGAYTNAALGGIPAVLDSHVVITAPPQSPAQYGYEAMSLMLSAVTQATDRGTKQARRSKVLTAIFHTRDRQSVLGVYNIDRAGDTTLRSYGVYRVVQGRLVLWKTLAVS